MGALKESLFEDEWAMEDNISRAYSYWEDVQSEWEIYLFDQTKRCRDIADTLVLQSCVKKLPLSIARNIDTLSQELNEMFEAVKGKIK